MAEDHPGNAEEAVPGWGRVGDSEVDLGLDILAEVRDREADHDREVDLGLAEDLLDIADSSDTVGEVHHSCRSFGDDSQAEVAHDWEEGLSATEEGSLNRPPGCKSGTDRAAEAGIRPSFADCTYLRLKEIF